MATALLQVYRCGICGNMVEVIHASTGTLTCCGEPMLRLSENTTDAAEEKHVPLAENMSGGLTVKVGAVAHPMVDDHFIEWIEVIADGGADRRFLRPGDAPEAAFPVAGKGITARAFCNLHGLWKC